MKLLRDIHCYFERSNDEVTVVEGLSDYSATELTTEEYSELANTCLKNNIDIKLLKDIDLAKRIASWFDNENIRTVVSNWYYSIKAVANQLSTPKLRIVNH